MGEMAQSRSLDKQCGGPPVVEAAIEFGAKYGLDGDHSGIHSHAQRLLWE
jgi:hypothetical protein